MKILLVHNTYQYRGGEDAVVEDELALLRAHGHEVQLYSRDNHELQDQNSASAAIACIWSGRTSRDLDALCQDFAPDLIHVHNSFPLISPALHWSAARRRIPVVQTLHNFRLLCPQASLLRHGSICEDCIGTLPWRAIPRKCYRDSSAQSAVVTGMLGAHRIMGTWHNKVARYIVFNRFCRDKFIQGGLPEQRIRIKPNCIDGGTLPAEGPRQGGLYLGRLSEEKGIHVLLDAKQYTPSSTLRAAGDGPLRPEVAARLGHDYLGRVAHESTRALLQSAEYLIAPSTCYETFGLAVLEAFSCATPAIVSAHGGLAELVEDGVTGLLVQPGDSADLAAKIRWADANPAALRRMGCAARKRYESAFTPSHNHRMLMDIYHEAIRSIRQPSLSA